MDNRVKFNIKQMVDCEKQEPFYPVTHAQAVKVIDNGQLTDLQSIIGILLDFIHNYQPIDPFDFLRLGYGDDEAYPGNEGHALDLQVNDTIVPQVTQLREDLDSILPISTSVTDGDNHPVTSNAVYEYVSNLTPDGLIADGDPKAVSGNTVYDYLETLKSGTISGDSDNLVTGSVIYNYLQNFSFDGDIVENENRAVTGHKIYLEFQNVRDSILWSKGIQTNSIIQKGNLGLTTTNPNEVAIGTYNQSIQDQTVFSVGIGSNGNLKNAIEVTNDIDNSLRIPYRSNYVSIQEHMNNSQQDILHITREQSVGLDALINKYLTASVSFTRTMYGLGQNQTGDIYSYYNNNGGFSLQWELKNKYGNLVSNINNLEIKLNNSKIYPTGNTTMGASGNFQVTSTNGNSLYDDCFNTNGRFTATFRLSGQSGDIPNIDKSVTVNLYAPSYLYCSTDQNGLNTPIPNDATSVQATSLSNFNGTINIPSQADSYVYIAIPYFMNTGNIQFKDNNTGFEFSINANTGVTTKSFNILGRPSVSVNYKILRSDVLLDKNTTWNIIGK